MDEIEQEDNAANKYYLVIGERVAIRRKALKMKQEDLAKAIGLTRTSIVNLEAGRQRIPIHTFYSIAEALKTNVHDLLPKDIQEIDEQIARVAVRNLAESVGLDPVEHEEELKEMIERLNRMKEGKNE